MVTSDVDTIDVSIVENSMPTRRLSLSDTISVDAGMQTRMDYARKQTIRYHQNGPPPPPDDGVPKKRRPRWIAEFGRDIGHFAE